MLKQFIETAAFTGWVEKNLDLMTYHQLQVDLMKDPNRGKVIVGSGGMRKIRVSSPRQTKGKRGGARIIYLHIPEVDAIVLVQGYAKAEKADLNAAEKRSLKRDAVRLKVDVMRIAKRESK